MLWDDNQSHNIVFHFINILKQKDGSYKYCGFNVVIETLKHKLKAHLLEEIYLVKKYNGKKQYLIITISNSCMTIIHGSSKVGT